MKALVIGGGIAGPVVAMSLQRVGIDATVFESRPAPPDQSGLFLNLASNGLAVLRALDVDLRERLDGHPMPRMVMSNGQGRRIGEVTNGTRLPDGDVSLCVKRGELQQSLRQEAVARGIDFVWGKRLVKYAPDGNGVVAKFADGSTETADLLVGADGIHSTVRSALDPVAPAASYTGLLSIGGYTRDAGLAPTDNTQHLVYGERAFFGYLVRPSGEAWWFANVARAEEPGRGDLSAVGESEWKSELQSLFRGDAAFIGDLIARSEGLGAYAIHDLPSVPRWHDGRAVLIGDAAHATSPNAGQGASMALEDALTLARSLRDNASLPTAFADFERHRRARVERVVKYSRSIGNRKAPGPVARRVRDALMPLALRVFANPRALSWLYDHRIDLGPPTGLLRTANRTAR